MSLLLLNKRRWSPLRLGDLAAWYRADRGVTLNAGVATVTCTRANAATDSVVVGTTTLVEGADFNRGANDNECATNLAAAIDGISGFGAAAVTNVVTITNDSTTADATAEAVLTTDDATAFALAGRGYVAGDGKFYATVSAWADQSGNGNTLGQTTASKQPRWLRAGVNGAPSVEFDGAAHGLQTDANIAFGVFSVVATVKLAGGAQTAILWEHTASGSAVDGSFVVTTSPTIFVERSNTDSSYNHADLAAALGSDAHVVAHTFDGSHAGNKLWIDGAEPATVEANVGEPGTATVTDKFNVGARNDGASLFIDGHFQDLVITTNALDLTAGEGLSLENYLETQAGI